MVRNEQLPGFEKTGTSTGSAKSLRDQSNGAFSASGYR
jgi:hypothetical protein